MKAATKIARQLGVDAAEVFTDENDYRPKEDFIDGISTCENQERAGWDAAWKILIAQGAGESERHKCQLVWRAGFYS